jgi:hypothetical protein
MVVYLDGIPVAVNQDVALEGPVLNEGDCYIGALMTNGTEAVFSGLIDDVRLYGSALSYQAISYLWQGYNVTGELQSRIGSDWTGADWLGGFGFISNPGDEFETDSSGSGPGPLDFSGVSGNPPSQPQFGSPPASRSKCNFQ